MKAPPGATETGASAGMGGPTTLILLILVLGATVYLWRMRYMRRKTFYVVCALVVVLIIADGIAIYNSG
jgi:uncharacterized protein YqgC (DUF456 family)